MRKKVDTLWLDQSERAAADLNREIGGSYKTQEKNVTALDLVPDDAITIGEARKEQRLVSHSSDRKKMRLLLITADVSMLEEGSVAYRRMTDQRDMFLEIHIVVLNFQSEIPKESVLRLFENVWLYSTNSSSWWRQGYDAYKIIESQLAFSGGFRADIIVAEDLFLTGLVGWLYSKKHERPFQLHISEDFFDASFVESHEHPVLYEWVARYLLNRATSVRTKTEFQRQAVIADHPELDSVTELLPNYHNLEVWKDFVPSMNLHERYPQFKFIMLNISAMRTTSRAVETLFGAAKILRKYKTVGLIMVGNGPLRPLLEQHAIALGIQNQVEFEPAPSEVISHIKSAHLLLHLSEDGGEDDYILEAAVAKLPMVANASGLAGKLFVDGESACLCSGVDVECIADRINMFLNENQDRARFALNAYEVVFERIEQDYGAYLEAYNQSIERCIVTES